MKGKRTNYVMVDDESAINVCPLKILPNLGVKVEELTKSDLVIRAYDDSARSVEGIFEAPVKTGLIETVVEFTMLDIPITYALLLGKPWYLNMLEIKRVAIWCALIVFFIGIKWACLLKRSNIVHMPVFPWLE